MDWLKWLIGLVGHVGLWCIVFNRIHATAWPRPTRKISEKVILLTVAIPIALIVSLMLLWKTADFSTFTGTTLSLVYLNSCLILGLYLFFAWVYRKLTTKLPAAVVETTTEWVNLKSEIKSPLLHGTLATALSYVPFNECLKLTRQRMTFALAVPQSLDGLKICQLSDLHYTGQIGIEYFQRIMDEANQFEPDLIVITGDIVDEIHCLEWLEPTLGRLKSKLGSYYVLGNHDLRIKNEANLRDRLERVGLIQASGQWLETSHQGSRIQITGNELPWYRNVNNLPEAPEGNPDLRILLSHSPDQIQWAVKRQFDLMLAGHTHGGQIALPVVGAVVAPSKYGVKYAAGTFQVENTLMHVSRGISGDEPIRVCSPPELGLFTVRATKQSD